MPGHKNGIPGLDPYFAGWGGQRWIYLACLLASLCTFFCLNGELTDPGYEELTIKALYRGILEFSFLNYSKSGRFMRRRAGGRTECA